MRLPVTRALEACPVEAAICLVGGSWKLTILNNLHEHGTLRFSELRRAIGGGINERTLARQLRELETDDLVHRKVYAQVPPRVEYRLTPWSEQLAPTIAALNDWGQRWAHGHSGDEA